MGLLVLTLSIILVLFPLFPRMFGFSRGIERVGIYFKDDVVLFAFQLAGIVLFLLTTGIIRISFGI